MLNRYFNQGYYEQIAVEYVPGAAPTAYFYDKENNEIESVPLVTAGDIDLEGIKTLLHEHGFELRRPTLPAPVLTSEITIGDFHYQFYGPGKLENKDAKEFASSLSHNGENGRLLTFSCKLQEDKVTEWISSVASETVAWLGASDQDTEGEWRWFNGIQFPATHMQSYSEYGKVYTNWHTGEPNNANNEEHCACYKPVLGWNDVSCNIGAQIIVEFGPSSPQICQQEDATTLSSVHSADVDHLEVNL